MATEFRRLSDWETNRLQRNPQQNPLPLMASVNMLLKPYPSPIQDRVKGNVFREVFQPPIKPQPKNWFVRFADAVSNSATRVLTGLFGRFIASPLKTTQVMVKPKSNDDANPVEYFKAKGQVLAYLNKNQDRFQPYLENMPNLANQQQFKANLSAVKNKHDVQAWKLFQEKVQAFKTGLEFETNSVEIIKKTIAVFKDIRELIISPNSLNQDQKDVHSAFIKVYVDRVKQHADELYLTNKGKTGEQVKEVVKVLQNAHAELHELMLYSPEVKKHIEARNIAGSIDFHQKELKASEIHAGKEAYDFGLKAKEPEEPKATDRGKLRSARDRDKAYRP